ncbi:MAG: c-type cytochrome [Acidobacteria bacterium]|nr:c-type cytochrome [Acidobacteriota bacterium]
MTADEGAALKRLIVIAAVLCVGCTRPSIPDWEEANPIVPIPEPPLGITSSFAELAEPPTPERVRLGRWLFYDTRLSADGSISCATCHRPEHGFSEPTAVSTGIGGRTGRRKAPSFVNQAWTLYPVFFWDGRAASLEEQALGPVQNPIEMGNTLDGMLVNLSRIAGYARYFEEAFGTPQITADRVAKSIADYERTRLSGNSPWDRWRAGDQGAVSDRVKQGHELFFGKAACNQCHLGQNFTDSSFHNLGVGWDPDAKEFRDWGRYDVTGQDGDRGAFKTPTLREVTTRAPYMHDGSIATLREVVEYYDRGGDPNPWLDPKMKPLRLTEADIDALVALIEALEGEGHQDSPPAAFPR